MYSTVPNDITRFDILGQLADKSEEHEFQVAQIDLTRMRLRFICITTAIAYLVAIYADSTLVSGSTLQTMIGIRICAAAIALFPIISSFRKDISPSMLGWGAGLYMAAIIIGEILELHVKGDAVVFEGTPITLYIVLLFYIYLPPQIIQSIITGAGGSIIYLFTLIFFTNASAAYITNTVLVFMLANGFGLYFFIRFGSAQRREFIALKELRYQAETDVLTGIFNRRCFMELGTREFNAAKRYGHPCFILMMDIDHFKRINDSYGHAVGDLVLKGLATRCKETLREVDLLGRIGGEEFAIVMPHCTLEQALAGAERIRKVIASEPFFAGDFKLNVTVSIGVAGMAPNTPTLDKLLMAADAALYQAKQSGRNAVSSV